MKYRSIVVVLACVAWACACTRDRHEAKPQRPVQASSARSAALAAPGRLIVLGFDGVDPRWLKAWAEQGKLPVIKRLMEQHGGRGFHALTTTNPPQSPVAWTSFATGTLPGDHGIYDFIARAQARNPLGLPVQLKVATTAFEVQPVGPPVARNLRSGTPFWQALGNQGVRVTAVNVPYSFPPDPMRSGRMLSGLGVPDLRETNSTFTYAGSEVSETERENPPPGGVMQTFVPIAAGASRFDLEGPTIPGRPNARMKLPVVVRASSVPDAMDVNLAGKTVTVPMKTWSDWIEVVFAHAGTEVHGSLKLLPLELGKRTRLFISPISFHPREPYSPISHPRAFSAQLAEDLGHLYKTVGWDHDTSALNAELIDEEAFLRDMDATERDRAAMLATQLAHDDFDLLLWVSTATDRVAHMFYRLIDPQHPRYDAALAEHYGGSILREYQRLDATVGGVLAKLRPADTLILLSDHGFHNYRRGLHVNQWLLSQGLLTLKGAAKSAEREFLIDVDWSATKAYAVGTGQIYFNVVGRERDGIVPPSEVASLTDKVRRALLELRDHERGDAVVVSRVYAAAEVFRGKRAAEAPDIQIGFAEHYRTSWETILGGVPEGLFSDNDKKWSGDHAASDFADTPGFILSNRPIEKIDPHIIDIAPTAHAHFGKPIPAQYTGKPLFGTPPPARD